MKIENIDVNDVIFAEYNPRRLTPHQAQDLKDSLSRFGFVDPVILNSHPERKNILIGGHQRLKVWKEMGNKIVPAVYVELTRDKERELNIRLNKNTGEWAWDELGNNFSNEELIEWGFTEKELFGNIDIKHPETEGNDDLPQKPNTITKTGDIYELGNHKLICGDILKIEDLNKLFGNEKAHLCITDPPYGVSYSDKNKFLNSLDEGNRVQTEIVNDNVDEKEIQKFWFDAFSNMKTVYQQKASYYIFGPQIQGMIMMMMKKAEMPYRHVIIWVKNNHVLGRCDYNYKHEPMFFGWINTHEFYGKGEFMTSVWEVDKPIKSDLHPTMKPVRLLENALMNSSLENQICLDPFLGSGSTLIACERLNRKCYGLEIEPHYCDVIVKRYAEFCYKNNRSWSVKRNGEDISSKVLNSGRTEAHT